MSGMSKHYILQTMGGHFIDHQAVKALYEIFQGAGFVTAQMAGNILTSGRPWRKKLLALYALRNMYKINCIFREYDVYPGRSYRSCAFRAECLGIRKQKKETEKKPKKVDVNLLFVPPPPRPPGVRFPQERNAVVPMPLPDAWIDPPQDRPLAPPPPWDDPPMRLNIPRARHA